MVTSFHHQPEAQHPNSSAINKLPTDYTIFERKTGNHRIILCISSFDRSGHQKRAVAHQYRHCERTPTTIAFLLASPFGCQMN